ESSVFLCWLTSRATPMIRRPAILSSTAPAYALVELDRPAHIDPPFFQKFALGEHRHSRKLLLDELAHMNTHGWISDEVRRPSNLRQHTADGSQRVLTRFELHRKHVPCSRIRDAIGDQLFEVGPHREQRERAGIAPEPLPHVI